MIEKQEVQEFKNGIFALRTTRFGTVAEIMIKKLYDLEDSGTLAFDKRERCSYKRVEVKFSTVMRKNDEKIRDMNVIEQCKKANLVNRVIKSSDVEIYKFDCNIQQVKKVEFDILYYGLFFADKIEIYKMTSDEVKACRGYSNKQHRGNNGEGQFHLNNRNISYHRENFFVRELTYEELYELFSN